MGIAKIINGLKRAEAWLLVVIILLLLSMFLIWFWYDRQLKQIEQQAPVSLIMLKQGIRLPIGGCGPNHEDTDRVPTESGVFWAGRFNRTSQSVAGDNAKKISIQQGFAIGLANLNKTYITTRF